MLNYWNLLSCLSILSAVTFTKIVAIEIIRRDINDLGYNYYQVVPNTQDKVEIKVYYESLCPACINFHTVPLAKVIQKLGRYLNYESYPFGNAKMTNNNGKIVIKCQHGPDECYGNKLHACAIDIINDAMRSEEYNSCMMAGYWGGEGSTDMDATNCGEKMGLSAQPIIDCANSQKGEDLAEYYGKESAKVQFQYVPYVLVNGKQFAGEDEEFMGYVCAAFTNPPTECKQ